MDTDLLVEKIEDGERLIRQLIRDQFDVEVAFWAKGTEEDLWRLYVASRYVRINKSNEAFRTLYVSMGKITACSVLLSDITLLSDQDPIARDAVTLRDRHPNKEPMRFQGKRLGNSTPVELCIYPRRLPMKVRHTSDGQWQVLISEPDLMWLTCDSEDEAQAIAAAPVLEYEALAQLNSGEKFAGELAKTADALAKHRMSFGYRFFTHLAEEARK
jgi:hypothetical protein